MGEHLISSSILAADFGRLNDAVAMVNQSEADFIHIDIMDGTFVPNLSFGFPVCAAIQKVSQKPLDFHLMIEKPDRYLQASADVGAAIIHVHLEADTHLHRTIEAIHKLDIQAGIAINPHTPVQLIEDLAHLIDYLLIMSVNPGFGGQIFIDHTYQKVQDAVALRKRSEAHFLIEIDGGVGPRNAANLFSSGADMLVAGSSVFQSEDPLATIQSLKNA